MASESSLRNVWEFGELRVCSATIFVGSWRRAVAALNFSGFRKSRFVCGQAAGMWLESRLRGGKLWQKRSANAGG